MEKRSERIKRQRKERIQNMHFRWSDLLILVVMIGSVFGYRQCVKTADHYRTVQSAKVAKRKSAKTQVNVVSSMASLSMSSSMASSSSMSSQNTVMRTPINWQEPSENRPYPDLNKVKNFWIKVSLKKNRTYLMSGKKVIYTMYSSGGTFHKDKKTGKMVSSSPTGTFKIESERGNSFFNGELQEGANYWLSWKDHGVYLFHSVPTKADGSYDLAEAAKLGKEPASHGCIRLTVPDAKWMKENVKTGTKVVVQNK